MSIALTAPSRRSVFADGWVRIALVVWTILAVMSIGRAALANNPRHSGCYDIFKDSGRHWLDGEDLYDHVQIYSLTVFRYAPTIAALMAPLGEMPVVLGNGLLRTFNLVVFLGALFWWQRVCLPESVTPRRRAQFFVLVAIVVNNYLMDVQVNLLAAGLLVMTVAGATSGRWWIAAFSIGLAVVLKAYPVSFALVLCVLEPRRFAWRWVLAQAAWFALPFLLQHPDYVLRQYSDWTQYGLNARFLENWFLDAMYLAKRFGVSMTRDEFTQLSVLVGLLVAIVSVIHSRIGSRISTINTAYCLCIAWMMAWGPSSEQVTYILAAPAVAMAVFLSWYYPNPRWFREAMGVVFVLLAGTQFELLFPGPYRFRISGAHPAALMLFMLAVAIRGCGYAQVAKRQEDEVVKPDGLKRAA